jgi:hypothetical protein
VEEKREKEEEINYRGRGKERGRNKLGASIT